MRWRSGCLGDLGPTTPPPLMTCSRGLSVLDRPNSERPASYGSVPVRHRCSACRDAVAKNKAASPTARIQGDRPWQYGKSALHTPKIAAPHPSRLSARARSDGLVPLLVTHG